MTPKITVGPLPKPKSLREELESAVHSACICAQCLKSTIRCVVEALADVSLVVRGADALALYDGTEKKVNTALGLLARATRNLNRCLTNDSRRLLTLAADDKPEIELGQDFFCSNHHVAILESSLIVLDYPVRGTDGYAVRKNGSYDVQVEQFIRGLGGLRLSKDGKRQDHRRARVRKTLKEVRHRIGTFPPTWPPNPIEVHLEREHARAMREAGLLVRIESRCSHSDVARAGAPAPMKSPRGRRPSYDAKEDQKLFERWEASGCKTYEAFADSESISHKPTTKQAVRKAIERYQHRQRRMQ